MRVLSIAKWTEQYSNGAACKVIPNIILNFSGCEMEKCNYYETFFSTRALIPHCRCCEIFHVRAAPVGYIV